MSDDKRNNKPSQIGGFAHLKMQPGDPDFVAATVELNKLEGVWGELLKMMRPLHWRLGAMTLVRFGAMLWIRGGGDVTDFVKVARHWARDYRNNPPNKPEPPSEVPK